MRRLSAGKRDANEDLIFQAFRAAGCAILPISKTGAPDAIVFCRSGAGWRAIPIEIKARLGKLTEAQIKFRQTWTGPEIQTVRTVERALELARGV